MIQIYVYQKDIQEGLDEVFLNLNGSVSIDIIDKDMMKVILKPSLTEETIDYPMLHASIVGDFDIDTTIVYVDQVAFDYLTETDIINHLHLMKYRVYNIEQLLIYFSQSPDIKHSIKRKLIDVLGQDYVNTILMLAKCNLNLSITAKQLFLHRNSLNYRIEKLFEKTGIDIKTFSGLRALISIIES